MRIFLNFLFAASLVFLSACSPKTPKAKASAGIDGASMHDVAAWNWDAYPAVRKMKLGTLPCTLHPRSQITINSTLAGALKLYVTQPQTNLESGIIWGEFEPKIFEVESNAIAEARIKLDDRERLLMELEIPKQRLTLERQLEEMQRQVAMVRMLTTNREFADLTLRAGDNTSVLRPDALFKAEAELKLLNQSMTYLKETNMAALGIDLPGMRSQWEQRKVEYERRRSQATLKMPFAGQLTVSLPLAEGVAEYPVNIGQELGVARDLSVVRLRVPLANSAWNALPPERLVAMIRLPNGGQLEAQFAYQKIERNQNREESAYYFQFLPEHTASVARFIGTDVTCELWAELGQLTRIVPKLALVMHNQAAFQSGQLERWIGSGFSGRSPGD